MAEVTPKTPTSPAPASAPSSSPTPTTPQSQSTEPTPHSLVDAGGDGDTPFDDVDTGFLGTPKNAKDDETPGGEPASQAQVPPVEPQAPATPAPAVATPAPSPTQPEVPAPVQPATPPAAAPVAPPAEPPATPAVDGAAAMAEYRSRAITALESYFALDQAAADELTTDPVKAVPKLMTRVMFETIQATMQAVHHFLPQLIEQNRVQRSAADEIENKFYSAWPKLDKKAHDTYIRSAASVYRQMYPQAKLEDIIRAVGAQAMVAYQIPFEAAQPSPQGNGAAPPAQTPIPPHRPAAAAAPRAAPTAAPEPRNIFVEMAEDYAAGHYDD